jgi:hypothetical protein
MDASTLVWNVLVPVLALALLLGAPLVPALAAAAAVWVALAAVLAPTSRRRLRHP